MSSHGELKIHGSGEENMKKGVLVCVAVLAVLALVSAPLAAATKVNFGLKAGVSFANNRWSDDDGTEKALIRPTFGAFALIGLSPTLAIQPEINYLVTGEWWNITDGTNIESFTYVHIPVLLRVRLMKEGKIIPVAFAGPAIGFLRRARDQGDDVKVFFDSTDFGADFGVGAEMPAGKMKALFDLRYYLGLKNVWGGPSFSMYNRSFIITAGLIF
jgi:Outer membrane protein beta-barrel domain